MAQFWLQLAQTAELNDRDQETSSSSQQPSSSE
jgi:hypothetical protein